MKGDSIHDIWIYNNIFHITTALDPYPDQIRFYNSNGGIAGPITSFSDVKIMGNVFADGSNYSTGGGGIPNISICYYDRVFYTACSATATNSQITNNLFINEGDGGTGASAALYMDQGVSGWTIDHNDYYYGRSGTGEVYWRGTQLFDLRRVADDHEPRFFRQDSAPFVFLLLLRVDPKRLPFEHWRHGRSGGADLASYSMDDLDGLTRPQAGAVWDIGPYENRG